MKTISIIRIACVALLLMAGLPTAQAQGIRVHYKNGNTVDVPASLFDHMSPSDIDQANPAYIIYKTDGTELKVTQDELDYVETYEGEFDQRITQQIPKEYLEKMASHMPIYAGNTPPAIEGTFCMDNYTLVFASDNFSSTNLADIYLQLSEQNTSKNTIMYQDKQGYQASEKTEMIVMGKGNNFTVFAVVPGSYKTTTYKLATIVSGTMTDGGIKDCYQAILMVDKNDPDDLVMAEGTYRIFKDGDGLAAPASWSSRSTVRQRSGVSAIAAK